MNYYYLDGLDKKGPYNSGEIKARKLSLETLIYKDGASSWLPLANFPELQQPIAVKESNEVKNESSEKINDSGTDKIKIPVFLIICVGLLMCLGTGFIITHFERKSDFEDFKKEIDNLFNNKTAISDYSYSSTSGQSYEVFLSSPFGQGFEKTSVQTKKHYLTSKPYLKENAKDYEVEEYNRSLKLWDNFKDLVEYYEADRYTGFTVLRLEKIYDRYSIEETWSGDMAYKVGKYKHYDGYSTNYYSAPGYDIPTNRLSVSEAYKEAAKFLTVENEDKSYEAGSYSKISSFASKESNFYEIEQDYPRYSYFSDTIFVQYEPNKPRGHVIDYYKMSRNTSRNDGNVYNSHWIVWYKSYSNKYSVKEKDIVFVKKSSIYSAGLFSVFIVSFYIVRYRKKIQIQ